MKTKRRHELQTNILADWLGRQIELVRPYAKWILGAAIAVAVIGTAAWYMKTTQSQRSEAAWGDYFDALMERDSNRLRAVAEDHAGTPAALWAQQSAADLELGRGIDSLFSDRKEAQTALERARDGYEAVAESASDYPLLKYRALWGLGVAYESLAGARSGAVTTPSADEQQRILRDVQNYLEQAEGYYRQVAENAPEASLREMATERLDALTRDLSAEAWYAWFAQQTPTPPGAMRGGDMPLPSLPSEGGTLPGLPDLGIPLNSGAPSGGDEATEGEAKPATSDTSGEGNEGSAESAAAGTSAAKPDGAAPGDTPAKESESEQPASGDNP